MIIAQSRDTANLSDDQYPGGVLFEKLGSGHRTADQCTPILDHWARLTGYALPPDQHITPDILRGWLDGHGAMLIVLDDIWDSIAIQPLLDAAPRTASLLLTTRKQSIAREKSDQIYPLDILSSDDALKLLRARMTRATDADDPLLQQLARGLGYHALALDIAGRNLNRWDKARWKEKIEELAHNVRQGKAFGEIPFPGEEERVSPVEAALKSSYDDLEPRAQTRFRALGAFAPDAGFRAEFAAALWNCSPDEAWGTLTHLAECGLAQQTDTLCWQPHLLLRDYALALLRRADEEATTRRKHAEIFSSAMRKADDKQEYYVMLPEYPQLRHAFEWAIENALETAQDIAANAGNLQAQFGFVRDNDDWSRRLLELARKQKDEQILAQAFLTRGNALSRVATLPGEDRTARLRQALTAYDEALKSYRPDTAPLAYATTQNNRGNLLRDLANLPDEDRAARLRQALAAYDEALRFRRSDTAPLDYAMTQGNLANLSMAFAELPGEDKRAHWKQALAHVLTALALFIQQQHAPYAQQAANLLRWIAETCGETFPELWKELGVGEMPEWLKE